MHRTPPREHPLPVRARPTAASRGGLAVRGQRPRAAALLALTLLTLTPVPTASAAGPAASETSTDPVELLRTRPTGMDEATWRVQRREVARELGSSRDPKAVDALIEVVQAERFDAVLTIAIESLASLGDPRALPALQRVYADRSIDTFVREAAAKAIVALGGTPTDDARLLGTTGSVGDGSPVLEGPQLGTMGEASVEDDTRFETPVRWTGLPLPSSVRARSREFGFALGTLGLAVNTLLEDQPLKVDVGAASYAGWLDERERWGYSASGLLDVRFANGDFTFAQDAGGNDVGDTFFVRQGLQGSGEAHVYFGRSQAFAFGQLGLSERVQHVEISDAPDVGTGSESTLTDTRFALDVTPAGGLGWGRHLDAGSELLVDAIVRVLEEENILAKPLDAAAIAGIREALYAYGNAWSSYPRLASVLDVLQRGGHLARRPSPRLVHRLRSVVEDPSFVQRMQGLRVRAGFLYALPVGQDDLTVREGDAIGAPFIDVAFGAQFGRERELVADLRGWYDVIGLQGFTAELGGTYRRFFHTRYDDYRGQWHAGLRAGASQREFPDVVGADGQPADVALGLLALARAGYGYGFRRGSALTVEGYGGLDSGGFVVGVGLDLRIGLVRASVLKGPAPRLRRGRGAPPADGSAGAAASVPAPPSAAATSPGAARSGDGAASAAAASPTTDGAAGSPSP